MGAYSDKVNAGHKIMQFLGQTATTTGQLFRSLVGGVPQEITSIRVVNRANTGNVLVSTDGGATDYATLPIGASDIATESVHEITITASTGSISFDLFFTVRQ